MAKSDRRGRILNVVVDLLATRGLEGVTHRAVDEAANLPLGSASYYFPKKSMLLQSGAEYLAAQLEKDCDALQVNFADVAAKDGMDAAVDQVASALVSSADEFRNLFLARIELTMASARRDDLADVGPLLTSAAQRPIKFFLQLISEDGEEMPIDTCAGLIDGIGLMHATGQGPKPTTDQIAAVFRSVV